MPSKMLAKFALPQATQKSWLESTMLVALAAGITYVLQHSGTFDFGSYGPMITAGLTMLLNYLNKVIQNPVDPTPTPNNNSNSDDHGVNFPI